jgi:hypothetical protein
VRLSKVPTSLSALLDTLEYEKRSRLRSRLDTDLNVIHKIRSQDAVVVRHQVINVTSCAHNLVYL